MNSKNLNSRIDFIKRRFYERVLPHLDPKEGLYNSTSLSIFVILCSMGALYFQTQPAVVVSRAEASPIPPLAENIPDGYAMAPVELTNYETLDSVSGQFSVVDLYAESDDPEKPPELVAKRVSLFRPPIKGESSYALVPEDQFIALVRRGGRFRAVLRNPKSKSGMKIVKKKSKVKQKKSVFYLED